MYKVSNTLTSAYGDMDFSSKQGPVREYVPYTIIGLMYPLVIHGSSEMAINITKNNYKTWMQKI